MRFEAKDSANQVIAVERVIYVEASSVLTEAVTVNGSIFDVGPDRILFLDKTGTDPILKIRNRLQPWPEFLAEWAMACDYRTVTF